MQRDSVVLVSVFKDGASLFDISGVLVREPRYVLTALPAVTSGNAFQVRPASPGGFSASAQLVAFDERLNLAVLRMDAGFGKPIALASMIEARSNDAVEVVTFPFVSDTLPTRSPGSVERIERGPGDLAWLITTASIPANGSGGVAFDAQGRLLGIATTRAGSAGAPTLLAAHQAVSFLAQATTRTAAVPAPTAAPAASAPSPSSSTAGVLPYLAYGSGLRAGQVIEARRGAAVVARAVADGDGNWSMRIMGGQASPGDRLTLTLDGAATSASFTYTPGQFPAPPGFVLR